jgi:hypothetical protein
MWSHCLRIAVAFAICACRTTSAGNARPPIAPAAAPGVQELLDRADAAILAHRFDDAKALLERARPLAEADRKLDRRAIDLSIATSINLGEYEEAAHVLLSAIRRREADPDDADMFTFHNWMVVLRQAQGDLAGALLECAARTASGYEGTWQPAPERLKETRFKDDWHRAYLFRIYAEQVSGSRREAALLAAEQARKAYTAAGGYPDSIALLDAFFAMHDHRWEDALAAARRVDIAKDDDEEDLYLLFSAFDAAGDKQAASEVRKRMEQLPAYWVLWRIWVKHDTEDSPDARQFSARYPTGKPPAH